MPTHDHTAQAKRKWPLVPVVTTSLVSAVLALTGCAVGPKYVKPEVPLNDAWSDSADARVETSSLPDSAWWQAFNDATLDSLIQLAYRQNLPLQVAGLRIMETRAQLGLAVGRQWPQVQEAFGAATSVGVSEHAANTAFLDRYFWDFQLGFDAAWEMDFWGKYGQDVRAQAGTYLATVADYDDALVSLLAEVARTYTVVRSFEALIEQARANVVIQEEGLRIAESRYRNGATSELDVTQATTLLEGTRSSIPELESGRRQAQNALSTLLGQPTGSLAPLLAGSAGIPAAPPQVAISVPAEVLRRRPDVRGAEFSAIAQCARIGVAKADLYPRFALFGSVGTQASGGTNNDGTLFGPGSLFYQFGPQFVWTLFNYGRTKNNIRVQDARYQQLLVGYENTVLRAAQEVEDAATGYLSSQEAATYAQNATNAAQRSADLAALQYREGAVDYQRVLDAQRSLLQEQNSLVRTRSSIATNLIALYKALGGGWELRDAQPFVPDSMQVEMRERTNWGDYLSGPPPSQAEDIAPPTSNGSSSPR